MDIGFVSFYVYGQYTLIGTIGVYLLTDLKKIKMLIRAVVSNVN